MVWHWRDGWVLTGSRTDDDGTICYGFAKTVEDFLSGGWAGHGDVIVYVCMLEYVGWVSNVVGIRRVVVCYILNRGLVDDS